MRTADRIRRAVAAAATAAGGLLALGAPLGQAADAATGPFIQPGEYVRTRLGSCTLAFVFDGVGELAGNVYVSTADHCIVGVGDGAWLSDGTRIGSVAFADGKPASSARDYAFIQVDPANLGRVRAAVKGYPAYPKGYVTSEETATGDLVQISGYAGGASVTAVTREQRMAVLVSDSPERAELAGPIWWGDSGGPLVHIPTGKALGIVSRLCFGACTERNATIEGVLAKASEQGFTVALRTVAS